MSVIGDGSSVGTAEQGRPHREAAVFFGLLTIGVILSLALGFHAVVNRPILVVSSPVTERQGLVTTATVVVANRSSHTAYCATVSVSALDSSGTAFAIELAAPLEGNGRIGPTGSASFRAVFRNLSVADYRDKLDKWKGFVIRSRPCD